MKKQRTTTLLLSAILAICQLASFGGRSSAEDEPPPKYRGAGMWAVACESGKAQIVLQAAERIYQPGGRQRSAFRGNRKGPDGRGPSKRSYEVASPGGRSCRIRPVVLQTKVADGREPNATSPRADVDALLAKVRDVLPEGWEATLYWNPEDPKFVPLRVGSLDEKWRSWLPGMDGRRIEICRKKAVHFQVDAPGSDPAGDYTVRDEKEYPRFALTLGDARPKEEIKRRLAELEDKIKRLEIVLKPSFHRQEEDGYVRHTVPGDDKGRRALQEYYQLWTIKRWFPQWSEGSVSVGFRSLVGLRMLPEDAKVEYRQVKEEALNTLNPIPGWKYIPADEE